MKSLRESILSTNKAGLFHFNPVRMYKNKFLHIFDLYRMAKDLGITDARHESEVILAFINKRQPRLTYNDLDYDSHASWEKIDEEFKSIFKDYLKVKESSLEFSVYYDDRESHTADLCVRYNMQNPFSSKSRGIFKFKV